MIVVFTLYDVVMEAHTRQPKTEESVHRSIVDEDRLTHLEWTVMESYIRQPKTKEGVHRSTVD